MWSWDCGFKLNFDGPILSASSRFYPPKEGYGPDWDGEVYIILLGGKVSSKQFKETTLDALKEAVDSYVQSIVSCVSLAVETTMKELNKPTDAGTL